MNDERWIPAHVREHLEREGYRLPIGDMEGHIREWASWLASEGEFYDYTDSDSFGRRYAVHRRSIRPAMRVCREWGSLILNERTQVVSSKQRVTDFLARYFAETGFWPAAQDAVVRAFGLGTAAFALWVDASRHGRDAVRVRCYDARMCVPLSWDTDGVSECAFVTRSFWRGRPVDQLSIHRPTGEGGAYAIETVCFGEDGNAVEVEGVLPFLDTGCATPTFAVVHPAVQNTRAEFSPYGQSVFADAVDAIQSVDLAFDAIMNEIDLSKMRIFLSDVMFDREEGGKLTIPFGKGDCTVFRKVMSTDDLIQEFAPALRTAAQGEAFRLALQVLGDLCGFGLTYWDTDAAGYMRTATEVCSDNSALMRNIRRHENLLSVALCTIARAVVTVARAFGERVPDAGELEVAYDDSIIQDTQTMKAADMAEVGVTMHAWEYRAKWYGEDEATAKAMAEGLDAGRTGAVMAATGMAARPDKAQMKTRP